MSATVEREARVADALRRWASRAGRSPSAVVVDRVWRFFCSVRAAAYEIVFLALLVLIGTLKGSVIPAQIPRYVPALEPIVAAGLYLVVDRRPRSWLPSGELLDDAGVRAVAVGFPAQTMPLILGSVWAHEAWGAYWSWDPKETGALFTWLAYGVYLHVRSLRRWRGRRSALFPALAFGTVVFTYFGNYWFGGLHAYSGV